MRKDDKITDFKPIERTFSWFDNDRRLCRNYELLFEYSEKKYGKIISYKILNKI